MALKGQRPPHPGRLAEVRGLDLPTWDLCLRCWGIGTAQPCDVRVAADQLQADRDNEIVCPVGWPLQLLKEWTSSRVPVFYTEVSGAELIESTRDVSTERAEFKGYLTPGKSTVEVTFTHPAHMRRSSLRVETVCAQSFASRQCRLNFAM